MKLGYYLTLPGQIEETQDHVNLLWLDTQGRLPQQEMARATTLGKAVVIDMQGCLFGADKKLLPDATERVQSLRTYIKLHGSLSAVEVLVPCDEPNLPERDVQNLIPEAVRILRYAWPEALVGCIYYNDGRFQHHHLFDVLGFDDYLGGFGICQKPRWYERIKLFFGGFVRRGSYLRFAELLRPDQRTWLIPGGTYGEQPGPWVEFAKRRPEVWAIVGFLWPATADGNEQFLGISGQPEVRSAYIAAGLSLLESA